jgi:FMN phosphatase YigB (HAD superfamily)
MIKAITFDCWDTLIVDDERLNAKISNYSEYSDIVGAKSAGMKAILFTGINKKYRDTKTADFVIDSYSELMGVMEKL